jgi:hypothetical protein
LVSASPAPASAEANTRVAGATLKLAANEVALRATMKTSPGWAVSAGKA